jgi:predicted peroxiredoxin
MVVANAAAASGKNTMVFLSSEGVRLPARGVAETILEEGFQSSCPTMGRGFPTNACLFAEKGVSPIGADLGNRSTSHLAIFGL